MLVVFKIIKVTVMEAMVGNEDMGGYNNVLMTLFVTITVKITKVAVTLVMEERMTRR